MELIFYFLIWCFLGIISINKYHKRINYLTIFNSILCFFGMLSCFGLYSIRKPNFYTHSLIWLFMIIINFVFLLFSKNVFAKNDLSVNKLNTILKRAKYLEIVSLVLISPFFLNTVKNYLVFNDVSLVRQAFFQSRVFESYIQEIIFKTLPLNMLSALVIIFILLAIETKKIKLHFISLFNVALLTFIGGGRHSLIAFVYAIVIVWISGKYSVRQNQNIRSSKFKKHIKSLCFIIIAIMIAVTIIRGQSFFKSLYSYFSGSISFLDYILDNPYIFKLNEPLFGYLTFSAILEPIVLLLKILGLTTIKIPSYEFNIICQNYYNIGSNGVNVFFNANTTIIYYFLRDFGVFGIFIGGIYLGRLASLSLNKWNKGSFFWGLMFIYVMTGLFNSLMTFQFYAQDPIYRIFTFWIVTQNLFTIKNK